MNLTFYGAAKTVTGSMHLVETEGTRLLLDCGLYQGRRADFYTVNGTIPFPAESVEAVVLSHAHLDHCGNLPTLVRAGFTGFIYCTPATRDLAALVLRDSAKAQQQDTVAVNKVHQRQGQPLISPLYTADDAEQAIKQLVAIPYGRPFPIGSAIITFSDAGHILGSASVYLEAEGRALGFSGDLGRPGSLILRDPEPIPPVEVLIMESTYGGRFHSPWADGEAQLAASVTDTVSRHGKVLIPAFAIGRTQDVAYALNRLRDAEQIPSVATFVDSPMAVDATEIFRLHPECFDDDVRAQLDQHDPFGFKGLRYVRKAEESKLLNVMEDPFIVIATSGMCESGRILLHLRRYVGDPRSALLIVGFQAEQTLGRRLQDGVSPVNILGEPYEVRLRVHEMSAFSAHADQKELLTWVQHLPKVGRIFLVHGGEDQAIALAGQLRAADFNAEVATRGQQVSV
jgi:metallo-beta-lactamase family protein